MRKEEHQVGLCPVVYSPAVDAGRQWILAGTGAGETPRPAKGRWHEPCTAAPCGPLEKVQWEALAHDVTAACPGGKGWLLPADALRPTEVAGQTGPGVGSHCTSADAMGEGTGRLHLRVGRVVPMVWLTPVTLSSAPQLDTQGEDAREDFHYHCTNSSFWGDQFGKNNLAKEFLKDVYLAMSPSYMHTDSKLPRIPLRGRRVLWGRAGCLFGSKLVAQGVLSSPLPRPALPLQSTGHA